MISPFSPVRLVLKVGNHKSNGKSDATVLAGIYELARIVIMLDEQLSGLYRKCF